MSSRTSGLQRDVRLLRRRAWLFVPFLFLGVLVAIVFSAFAGETNAVAELELDTVINDAGGGGDRGLRIFEAQSMTDDAEFRAMVIAEIGDPNFDYARFDVELDPISVAAGVSRGILTISIKDRSKGDAEKFREAFVDIFEREYLEPDGLFRKRFLANTLRVAEAAEAEFAASYAELSVAAAAQGIAVDELFRSGQATSPLDALNVQEGELRGARARAQGTLATVRAGGLSETAIASLAASVLGETVQPGDGEAVLAAQVASLETALASISEQIAGLSDGTLDPGLLTLLDEVRGLDEAKEAAFVRVANARIAIGSSDSTLEIERTFSGGLAGSYVGLIAVVLAVTLVFGLIAIYTLEWLSQVRGGSDA